jgi:hypothetical protein
MAERAGFAHPGIQDNLYAFTNIATVAQVAFAGMPEKALPMLDIAKFNSDKLVAFVNRQRMNLGKEQRSPKQINAGEITRQVADVVEPPTMNHRITITARG